MSILKRRITYGTNVIIGIIVVFALVIMANYITYKYPKRYDFVQTSDLYKISDKTKNVLKTLDKDVNFYVFSNPQESELYTKLERLIKAYQAVNPKVKLNMLDKERDIAKVRKIVKDMSIDEPDSVGIKYGDEKKVLTEMDMADFNFKHNNYTGGQIKELKLFKAEQAFTSAIIELMNPRKYYAKFTVKHGEKSIFGFNDVGASEAKRYLLRDNVIAEPIELVSLKEIPTESNDVLVVAGPTREFMPHEVNLVRQYLSKGGRALFMLDPQVKTGLEPLLEEHNVRLGDDLVVDPGGQIPGASPLQLIVGLYHDHPIVRKLNGIYTLFVIARSVNVIDPENDVNQARELAITTRRGWSETDKDTYPPKFNDEEDEYGPICVAVAVDNKKSGMRIVVFGDSDFIANLEFSQGANRDLFMNSINWLIKRETLISIGPKTIQEIRRLDLSPLQLRIVTVVVIVVVPLLSVVAGVIVYFRRRQ